MSVDVERLKRAAPFALPLLIVVLGWIFLVSPAASSNAAAGRQLDMLQQRLAQLRASAAAPPPPPLTGDPRAAFERQVAARDVSSRVILELSQLASSAAVTNLAVETGERVIVTAPTGPQVSGGGAQPDPRFGLFELPLAYSPILMSFDAEFDRVGDFLWRLRDLATTVELRNLEIKPVADGDGRVHVGLTLFAYARQNASAAATGALP